MSCYLDDSRNPINASVTCRLLADTRQELCEMAAALDLKPYKIWDPDTPLEHFNVSRTTRSAAILRGCVQIAQRDFLLLVLARNMDDYRDERTLGGSTEMFRSRIEYNIKNPPVDLRICEETELSLRERH